MREPVRVVLAGVTIVLSLGITLLNAQPASPEGPGRVLLLSISGEQLRINLPTEHAGYVLDPRNGDRLVTFTPEEASLIAEAMEERGLGSRVVEALYSLKFPRKDGQSDLDRVPERLKESLDPALASLERGPYCMHLDINGTVHQFSLSGGGPTHVLDPLTGERIVRFSLEDARSIIKGLHEAGVDTGTVMKVLFALRNDSESKAPVSVASPTLRLETHPPQIKLDPSCGSCLNGGSCYPNAEYNCCNWGGAGCSSCRVCG